MNKDLKHTIGLVIDIDKGAHMECFDQTDTHAFLKHMYRLIDCDLIDIVYARIGGVNVEIVVDDEGLLKEKRRFSAIRGNETEGFAPWLVGNLIVFGQSDDEYHTGLTEEEAATIYEYLMPTSLFNLKGSDEFFGKYILVQEED